VAYAFIVVVTISSYSNPAIFETFPETYRNTKTYSLIAYHLIKQEGFAVQLRSSLAQIR